MKVLLYFKWYFIWFSYMRDVFSLHSFYQYINGWNIAVLTNCTNSIDITMNHTHNNPAEYLNLHPMLKAQVDKYFAGEDITKLLPFLEEVNQSYNSHKTALDDQASKFKLLIDKSYDMVTVIDPDGTITYESPSFYRIFGYKPEEIIGHNGYELVHPEDFDQTAQAIQLAFENPGQCYTTQFRFRKKDGDYIYLDVIGSYVVEGNFTGLIVNSRDITERQRAEKQMTAQIRLLETITRTMPILVYKLDENGFCTSIKGNGLQRIGTTESKVVGRSAYEHFKDKTEDIARAYSGDVVNFINRTTIDEEEIFFEHFLFLDESGPGKQLIGFAIDVTEGKKDENRLKDYYDTLERTNRELDQFAYIVSHDLKAPLRAISNLSIWIEEDLGDVVNEDAKVNFDMMRGRIQRMESLINGILEYSRAGRAQSTPSTFSVQSMVTETVNALAPPDKFKVEIDEGMPEINADRIKIEQVFSNFISNAIKYNSSPEPLIKVGYIDDHAQHIFYVRDNGPGIDPDYHDKVFVIFQTLQARDKVESTGVGLAIVKKIVEDAGGSVWLESDIGQGATFYFSLPKPLAMAA